MITQKGDRLYFYGIPYHSNIDMCYQNGNIIFFNTIDKPYSVRSLTPQYIIRYLLNKEFESRR